MRGLIRSIFAGPAAVLLGLSLVVLADVLDGRSSWWIVRKIAVWVFAGIGLAACIRYICVSLGGL